MTTPDHRAQVIAGLRELAQYLEDNPDLPVPACYGPEGVSVSVGIDTDTSKDDDQACRAVVDAAAAILGGEPVTSPGDHYEAGCRFSGGISYRVLYIPQARMDEHAAEQSYVQNIRAAS